MKILHTSDWHIGKRLMERERLPEQAEALEELVRICDGEKIDVILVAGDVFDTFMPSADAEEVFFRAVRRLAGDRRAVVLISGNHKHIHVVDDQTTFEFKGSASELLRTMYPNDRRPSKSDYTRLIDSLNRMMAAVIKLSVVSQVDSDGKPMKQVFLRHMLEYANWDEVTKQLEVRVSPFFYLAYTQGNVTYLDSLSRYDLSGSIAKAMYRFVQSHREKYSGGYMVLAAALNMNLSQPKKEIRRKLREGVTELIKKGILTEESGFSEHDNDIIILEKLKIRAVKEAPKPPTQLRLA